MSRGIQGAERYPYMWCSKTPPPRWKSYWQAVCKPAPGSPIYQPAGANPPAAPPLFVGPARPGGVSSGCGVLGCSVRGARGLDRGSAGDKRGCQRAGPKEATINGAERERPARLPVSPRSAPRPGDSSISPAPAPRHAPAPRGPHRGARSSSRTAPKSQITHAGTVDRPPQDTSPTP